MTRSRLGDWVAGSLAALGIVHKHTWVKGVNRFRRMLELPDVATCRCDARRRWLNMQHSRLAAWVESATNSIATVVASVLRNA